MANKKVRVAVIGAGNMGRYHVRNYMNIPQANLVAIADLNPATEHMAKEHGIKHYINYKEMLDNENLEAVSIVVPTPFHAQVGKDVITRGINALVEKPIAASVAQANKLIELAKKHKVVFTVGHIERFNPVVRKLKQLIDSGKLGTVSSIVSKRVGGFPQVEPKTDVIIDLAVHDIDIMNYLLGKYPKKIHSHGSQTIHSSKVDSAHILLDYGDASGFAQANWMTPVKIRTISVTGSKGYAEGNYITQELVYYEHNMKKVNEGFETFVMTLGTPKKRTIKVAFQEPLAIELKNFLGHIRGNGKYPLVDPLDAREALRIAHAAIKKPQKGQV